MHAQESIPASTPVPLPFNDKDAVTNFNHMGVTQAWEKYRDQLTFGKGQTMALLDDCCDIDIPEWKVVMPWGPKVVATWNTMEDNDNPRPIPPAYHGTGMAFPSSLNYEGRGGIAFNNQIAPVRCVKVVHIHPSDIPTATQSMKKALEWVLENHKRLNITAVNLAPLDDIAHPELVPSDLDPVFQRLREENIWVSAPCGNNNNTTGISWPAASPYCYAVSATDWASDENKNIYAIARFDRNKNTDILAPAGATSSSNAFVVGSAMVIREAIEKTGYDWKAKGKTMPDAILAILKESGVDATDAATGLTFKSINLLNALDMVFAGQKTKS